MNIREILDEIEKIAPLSLQESYDNAGLICGDATLTCTGVLLCLDSIEAVVDEAIEKNCNLIIAHHPIVFAGLKKITGKNYIERVIIKAIKNDIAIYAAHTNLDNIKAGVNSKICQQLGLENIKILHPKKGSILKCLYTYVPKTESDRVVNALFAAGAGNISNYEECAFQFEGTGSFKGNNFSNPVYGEKGVRHYENETKIEVIFPATKEKAVIKALFESHPYEEVAYQIIATENEWKDVGSGMIGELPQPVETEVFLQHIKTAMKTDCIRYTTPHKSTIQRIAVCGGAGSFLLSSAIQEKADLFLTADFKYHQFFDADGKIIIADIGHFESEQFTITLFYDILKEKFGNFALHLTSVNTNPVKYL